MKAVYVEGMTFCCAAARPTNSARKAMIVYLSILSLSATIGRSRFWGDGWLGSSRGEGQEEREIGRRVREGRK